jgi:hypothetical protein
MDMWRSVLLGLVLAGVLAGCSLGGGSGGAASQATARTTHSQLDLVGSNMWVTSRVKRLRPTGGAHFTEIECDASTRPLVKCTGWLYYSPGGAVRVPQYFRIVTPHDGFSRVVPLCPPESRGLSSGGTIPRIFCAQ